MSPEKSQEMHGNGQVTQKGNRLITERPSAERERRRRRRDGEQEREREEEGRRKSLDFRTSHEEYKRLFMRGGRGHK